MPKIVVVGDVNGDFPTVLQKLGALHAKNDFALALFVGNFFADPQTASDEAKSHVESLLDGKINVPLPAYFALGTQPLPENVTEKLESTAGELCDNLYFLGKRTTVKTSEGIRIVSLGGVLDTNVIGVSKDKFLPFYTEEDARSLRGANTTDILVTSSWPADIRSGSRVAFNSETEPAAYPHISDLCASIKPRYHFSTSSQAFYEREPFFHPPTEPAADSTFPVTRFISLASFGNPKKQKWIYAFSLEPNAAPSISILPGATASPLMFSGKKRPAPPKEQSYRFTTDHENRRPHKRSRGQPPTPAECFFCLSNPNLATHLVTSIGNDAYLTTAKGPLSTTETFKDSGIDFPCHILIIPLTHAPTLGMIEGDDVVANTFAEMSRYRNALHQMLAKKAGGSLGSVTWEVSRAGGIHFHWQFIPLSTDMIKRGIVEAAFKVESENQKYPHFQKRDISDEKQEGDYFRARIWHSANTAISDIPEDSTKFFGEELSLVLPLDGSFRFDVQFGRRVLAKLLGLENRFNWKDCGQIEAEETADAGAFKKAFKGFDFSLEE